MTHLSNCTIKCRSTGARLQWSDKYGMFWAETDGAYLAEFYNGRWQPVFNEDKEGADRYVWTFDDISPDPTWGCSSQPRLL